MIVRIKEKKSDLLQCLLYNNVPVPDIETQHFAGIYNKGNNASCN